MTEHFRAIEGVYADLSLVHFCRDNNHYLKKNHTSLLQCCFTYKNIFISFFKIKYVNHDQVYEYWSLNQCASERNVYKIMSVKNEGCKLYDEWYKRQCIRTYSEMIRNLLSWNFFENILYVRKYWKILHQLLISCCDFNGHQIPNFCKSPPTKWNFFFIITYQDRKSKCEHR